MTTALTQDTPAGSTVRVARRGSHGFPLGSLFSLVHVTTGAGLALVQTGHDSRSWIPGACLEVAGDPASAVSAALADALADGLADQLVGARVVLDRTHGVLAGLEATVQVVRGNIVARCNGRAFIVNVTVGEVAP